MLVHQVNLSRQRSEELEVQLGLSSTEITRLQAHAAILEEQLQVFNNTFIRGHYSPPMQTLLQESTNEPRGDGVPVGQYRNIRGAGTINFSLEAGN